MESPDLPECPVCLQTYDGDTTIPRVLACGHSACELCLSLLPQPFSHTIRCPACTQLVKLPHTQGPSGLPKNIDLLRLSSLLQNDDSPKPRKPNNRQSFIDNGSIQFIPNLWSQEFYSNWKDWVVVEDAILVETIGEDGFYSALCGRIVGSLNKVESPIRCLLKENQKVSLVRVGFPLPENDSKFNYSYVAKVMQVLYGMKESERAELGLILRASCSRSFRVCIVYGLWYNSKDRYVYLVCARYRVSFVEKSEYLANGFGGGDENHSLLNKLNFAMISMEICEALIGLQSEGLITGFLSFSCFYFNDFGHLSVDFNEILTTGRRVRRVVSEAAKGKQKGDDEALEISIIKDVLEVHGFVSPEIIVELLEREGIELGSGKARSLVEYGSIIWSFACVLLWLFMGKPFSKEMSSYLLGLIPKTNDEHGYDKMSFYTNLREKVYTLLETKLGPGFESVLEILLKCLHCDPGSRPIITEVWKCIRGLIIEPKCESCVDPVLEEKTGHCVILGELCQLPLETNKKPDGRVIDGFPGEEENGGVGELRIERDLVQSISRGDVKCRDLKGHLDCITGLAIGGGFLFSSSFDKSVHVWSLQDFTNVHSFRGHEHRVMAVVFVDEEQPLCISGDSGGGIFIWEISIPFAQEPIKQWSEEKDWRYSGIHALATSGTQYLYTGSGDKSIKAWSLKDYTLLCTMTGHRSVVSALAVHDGVLYSGSWDGTVRLWCLSDHSPLTVLGEDALGNVTSVLSLTVEGEMLVVSHENGSIKIWRNDVLMKSAESHKGAIFSVGMEGRWLFTGGWDKIVNIQELCGHAVGVDAITIGSIACHSVITALLYWQGKLFVGHADRLIKVHYCGS